MKQKIKKVLKKRPRLPFRRRAAESKVSQAILGLPRITNETVAEHREEMLKDARKYIYPLKHTKLGVVKISVSLLVFAVILFFVYLGLALYKFQTTSSFIYGVTQVLPWPVAKAGVSWVSYEDYLFELRHYMHYYETQQQVDFKLQSGRDQLHVFKRQAMQEVVNNAYVKQLARQHHVGVSDHEVNDAVTLLREQNRLGSSDQELSDVLKEFWGWSISDFKRELKQQLLAQKVVAALDMSTTPRAQRALAQVQDGADFAAVAKQVSADPVTKSNGGE